MVWSYTYSPAIWLPFFTGLFLMALAVYGWQRRGVPGALAFVTGCLFTVLWVAGAMLEAAGVNMAEKVFWARFQAVWMVPATTAATCFVLDYVWPGRWLSRRNLVLLSFGPLLFLGFILTNDFHGLVWTGFAFNGTLRPLPGPVAWIFLTYSYSLGLLEIFAFGRLFLRSPQHRWPVALMLTGQIVARAVFLWVYASAIQTDLPVDVLIIAFLFLMYAIALFGFRIFDPLPLARQMAIDQLQAGLLVLDPQERVISLNPAAERILRISPNRARGRHVQDLLPAYQPGHLDETGQSEMEISLGDGPEVRHYILTASLMKDWRKLDIGRVLMLQDVTEQKQAQAHLVEQKLALAMLHERERLARELHDSLGQVFAFVNTQGQAVRRLLSQGDLARADEYTARLVAVAREADVDIRESILGLRVALTEHGLFPALTQYLEQYEKNYGIHTELVKQDIFADQIFDPLVEVQVLRIVQEALTNVRKHSGAGCVQIAFTREDGSACVTIRDDGQGFDPDRFAAGGGPHLGLRVMGERAEEVGGSLSLHSEPGQGAVVAVRVPVRKDGNHHD